MLLLLWFVVIFLIDWRLLDIVDWAHYFSSIFYWPFWAFSHPTWLSFFVIIKYASQFIPVELFQEDRFFLGYLISYMLCIYELYWLDFAYRNIEEFMPLLTFRISLSIAPTLSLTVLVCLCKFPHFCGLLHFLVISSWYSRIFFHFKVFFSFPPPFTSNVFFPTTLFFSQPVSSFLGTAPAISFSFLKFPLIRGFSLFFPFPIFVCQLRSILECCP